MFYHNINPVLFSILGLDIRYYGLFYVIGFIIVYFFMKYLAKERKLGLSKDEILDFLFYILIGGLIGARIGYVISHFSNYSGNLVSAFYIWQGGLAFYGGLIGALLVALFFCKKKNINFYKIADIVVIPLALAMALVRIANFINGELYGRITDVWWAVKFKGVEGFRHPYQIYASIKNLFIFFVLFLMKGKKHKDGFLFWLFVTLYGGLRFLVEFYREFSYYFFGLSFTQILSIIIFLIGLYFVYKKR